MQNPTAVGMRGYARGATVRKRAASAAKSAGSGLFLSQSGNEQISALFDHGVTVAMRASL